MAPKIRTQQTPSKLNDKHLAILDRIVEEHNDATLEELRDLLVAEIGFEVSRSTVDRALSKLGMTIKKRRSTPMRRKVSASC